MSNEMLSYKTTLEKIKEKIYNAQNKALQVVNKELVTLYWNIGKIITEKQEKEG